MDPLRAEGDASGLSLIRRFNRHGALVLGTTKPQGSKLSRSKELPEGQTEKGTEEIQLPKRDKGKEKIRDEEDEEPTIGKGKEKAKEKEKDKEAAHKNYRAKIVEMTTFTDLETDSTQEPVPLQIEDQRRYFEGHHTIINEVPVCPSLSPPLTLCTTNSNNGLTNQRSCGQHFKRNSRNG